MKRIMVTLLALALIASTNAATWASNVKQACPGKCPFCP